MPLYIFFHIRRCNSAVLLVTRAACVECTRSNYFIVKRQSGGIYLFIPFFFPFVRARDDSSLIRARSNRTVVRTPYSTICPRGTDGNGRAHQNRFKARLISRSAQIKPLALGGLSTDTRERNELRSNMCLTYVRAKEKYIQVTSADIN